MKHNIFGTIAIVLLVGTGSVFSLMGSSQAETIDTYLVGYQDETPPAPEVDVSQAVDQTQESLSDIAVDVDQPIMQGDSVLQGAVEIQPGGMPIEYGWSPAAPVASGACGTCCCQTCCCPPPAVPTTYCLVDPCTGCSYEVCVDVPPCCVGKAPNVDWRGGIMGRKVVRMCWDCCDKNVKVVITRKGKVRVRG